VGLIFQPAAIMEEIASGAQRDNNRKITGLAVKRVVTAVCNVVPRNLGIANTGRIGVHHVPIIIDPDPHLAPPAGLLQAIVVSRDCASPLAAETRRPLLRQRFPHQR
jgi:hypothetical protein